MPVQTRRTPVHTHTHRHPAATQPSLPLLFAMKAPSSHVCVWQQVRTGHHIASYQSNAYRLFMASTTPGGDESPKKLCSGTVQSIQQIQNTQKAQQVQKGKQRCIHHTVDGVEGNGVMKDQARRIYNIYICERRKEKRERNAAHTAPLACCH